MNNCSGTGTDAWNIMCELSDGQTDAILEMIKRRVPGISQEDLAEIESRMDFHVLPARHFISREGCAVTHINYLQSGLVKAFYLDETGDEIVIHFIEDGSFFTDFYAYQKSEPSKTWFQAIEPVVYASLPMEFIERLCERSHPVEHFYRMIISEIFLNWKSRTEDFQSLDAEDRYLKFLKNRARIASRVAVKDIASYLGIGRQSLTRIRKTILTNKK